MASLETRHKFLKGLIMDKQCILSADTEKKIEDFCNKYITLMELFCRDEELNAWCRRYSPYSGNTEHTERIRLIYDVFVQEAYEFMPDVFVLRPSFSYSLESALAGNRFEQAFGIACEIRKDYPANGSLISRTIADGILYRLMAAYLESENAPMKVKGGKPYSLEYIMSREKCTAERRPGGRSSYHDIVLKKWRMRIQLDTQAVWFLSVFVRDDGSFDKYSLDQELASDSHYEFTNETAIRRIIYAPGDEKKYFAEVLIRYVASFGGQHLLNTIAPYITAQYHFD